MTQGLLNDFDFKAIYHVNFLFPLVVATYIHSRSLVREILKLWKLIFIESMQDIFRNFVAGVYQFPKSWMVSVSTNPRIRRDA